MTHRTRFLLPILMTSALVLAGCGDDDPSAASGDTPTTTVAPTGSPAGDAVSEVQLVDSSFGKILADGDGNTLYLFTPDTGTDSTCTGGCADTWPPLTGPASGTGVDADDLATTTRDDGSEQVTFFGHPLYRYAADSGAGDTSGQGVGGKWYVVDADGNAVQTGADDVTTTAASVGGY